MAKTDIEDSEWNPEDAPPSKSSKKRAMTALQVLGTRLVNLTPSQLEQIPIEDARLQDAVLQARKITQRGGLRRQLQYIGKLMRVIDSEPIETALAKLDGVHQAERAQLHQLEQLRDALIAQGDAALPAALAAFPHADRQQLRHLTRQSDVSGPRAKEQARKLFRYLRELQESSDADF